MADEIYINEMTGVDLRGLAMEVTFFRQFLDTLKIVPEVFRVNIDGDSYKTAGDPFLEKTATEQMKENYGELLKDIYSVFVSDISDARSWEEEKTRNIIDSGPFYTPSEIIQSELVDDVMYPDEFEEYIESLTTCDTNEGEKKNKCEIDYSVVKWKDVDRSEEYIVDWSPKKKNNIEQSPDHPQHIPGCPSGQDSSIGKYQVQQPSI